MGRIRASVPRSRLPLHRRPFADPAALRRWLLVVALAASTGLLVSRAVTAANRLLAQGLLVPAIRFPTVARGAARLRGTAGPNGSGLGPWAP